MLFSTTIARPLQLVTRVLQWASAVIVMGLTSYFINRGPRGQHTIYQEVIVRYSRFLPLTDHHRAIISNRKPTYVGCPLRRLLPSGIHFAIHALVVEQICARYRRRLLLPLVDCLYFRRTRLQREPVLLVYPRRHRLQTQEGQ
jgi:hypothetical protein